MKSFIVTTFISFFLNCLLLFVELKTNSVPITRGNSKLSERTHARLINGDESLGLIEFLHLYHNGLRFRFESKYLIINLTVSNQTKLIVILIFEFACLFLFLSLTD